MEKTTPQSLQELINVFTSIPFSKMLGLHLEKVNHEHVSMCFNMKPELIGNFLHGILHGGVISSVLDMAGGMIVMASSIYKHPDASIEELAAMLGKCSTIDLQVSFLRPGRGTQFHAEACLIKSGKKISFTRMTLHNQDNTLIATGNGTYLMKQTLTR